MQKINNILIVTGIFPPDIGGPATYGATIENELKKRGFGVKVAVYSKTGRGLPRGLRHILFFLKLLPLVRKSDVVLSLNAVSAGSPALFAAKLFKKKFIVRIVGDYAWEIAAGKGKTNLLIDDFQKEPKRGWIGTLSKLQAWAC